MINVNTFIERLLTKLNAIPDDKVRHVLGGAVLASLVVSVGLPLFVAAIVVTVIAIGKELYDYLHRDHHTPDPFDAFATLLGGATVLLPIFLTR